MANETSTPETPAPAVPAAAPSPETPPAVPPAKPAEAAPATPAPEKPTLLTSPGEEEIKLKFADGVVVDDAVLGKFLPIAKDLGLKSDGAQKLADLFVETQRAAEAKHMEQVTAWAEQAKADKEIGGTAFDANLAIAKKALDRLATPGLKDVLVKSGLGNHPDVIRVFYKIGKTISEDRLPGSGGTAQEPGPSRDDLIREAFPNSPSMWAK